MATTLLNLVASGVGCDFIFICQGHFFPVHKAVIVNGGESSVLAEWVSESTYLSGEACVVRGVNATVFASVISFLYRGDITDHPQLLKLAKVPNSPTTLEELRHNFPRANEFISTIYTRPLVSRANGLTRAVDDAVKWKSMTEKQSSIGHDFVKKQKRGRLNVPFDVEILQAAELFHIDALKDLILEKVSEWYKKETQKSPPLSTQLDTAAGHVLQNENAFSKRYLSLCAKLHLAGKQNSVVLTLVQSLHQDVWFLLDTAAYQWKQDLENDQIKLAQADKRVEDIEKRFREHQDECKTKEEFYKSELEVSKKLIKELVVEGKKPDLQPKVDALTEQLTTITEECKSLKAQMIALKAEKHSDNEKSRMVQNKLHTEITSLEAKIASEKEVSSRAVAELEKVRSAQTEPIKIKCEETELVKDGFATIRDHDLGKENESLKQQLIIALESAKRETNRANLLENVNRSLQTQLLVSRASSLFG